VGARKPRHCGHAAKQKRNQNGNEPAAHVQMALSDIDKQ
jgi:hypothetical protein